MQSLPIAPFSRVQKSITTLLVLLSGLILIVGNAAAFTIFPFVGMGPDEDMANGVSGNWMWGEQQLFLTTGEGFHYYDFSIEEWIDRTWPDWIGRGRYAVVPVPGHPDRLAMGGVNAWFKGNLWLSEDMGQTDDMIYESNGGRVTDMAVTAWPDTVLFACTWSDMAPGELLRSDDFGASWDLMLGHGHHAMTGVEVNASNEIHVAGDNYVQRSVDGGLTWESLQANLPAGQGLYCLLVPEPVVALPKSNSESSDEDARELYSAFLMVSNDSGVYLSDAQEIDWQQVLPFSCRSLGYRFVQYDTFIFWDEWYAVTFDGRLLVNLNGDWDNWIDATSMIAPGTPIDVETTLSGVYVATTTNGVYHSTGIDGLTSVPQPLSGLDLFARPNPFNPSTELCFTVPKSGRAVIDVYDLAGRIVDQVFDGVIDSGDHSVVWQPRRLSSGVYQAVLRVADQEVVERVVLVK